MKQFVDTPMPQIMEDIVLLVQLVPFGYVHERIAKQSVSIPMPQIMGHIVLLGSLSARLRLPFSSAQQVVQRFHRSHSEGDWRNDRRKSPCWGFIWRTGWCARWS